MTALSFVWVILTLKNSGCDNHIKSGKALQAKTIFVMPFGKWEFNMVPFGLPQNNDQNYV